MSEKPSASGEQQEREPGWRMKKWAMYCGQNLNKMRIDSEASGDMMLKRRWSRGRSHECVKLRVSV